MPSYQDEELKSSSEFPSIKVRSSEAETFVKTEFDSNPTPPQSEDTISTEPAKQPTTPSSSNDTNSLESKNSDVSGFWGGTKMSDGPPKSDRPDQTDTQPDSQLPSDDGDTTQTHTTTTVFSSSTSGNTESAPSENSQLSGFWGESHRSGEAGDHDTNTNRKRTTIPPSSRNQQTMDKVCTFRISMEKRHSKFSNGNIYFNFRFVNDSF